MTMIYINNKFTQEVTIMKNCKVCKKEVANNAKTCPHCGAKLKMGLGMKVLIGFGAFILLAIIGSALGGNDKSTTTNSQNTVSVKKTDKSQPIQIIEVDAKALSKAFEENEIKANQTYKNKIAKITGTVDDIGEILEQTYIVLQSHKEFALCSTQCFFDDKDEIKKIADLKKGDEVTLQGTIDGKSMNVTVNDCKFVK
jgi:hypothetical protein